MISRNNVIAVCTPLTVVSRSSLMSLIITFMFEPAKLQMNCARASGRISRRADRAGLGANVRSTDTDASVTGLSATGARADATQTRLAQPLQPGFGDRVTGRARGGVSGDRRQEVRALQRVQVRVERSLDGRRSRHVAQERDLAEVVGFVRGRMVPAGID